MSRRIREIAWRRSPSRMWVFQVYIALSIVYRTYFLAIFGYQRKCPREPLAETFWDIKKCDKDKDWYVEESKKFLLALHINMEYKHAQLWFTNSSDFPRICCPSGRKRYCMTTELPQNLGKQLSYPVEALSAFLQCTPPPPVAFDRYPKSCNSSLQCFPHIW